MLSRSLLRCLSASRRSKCCVRSFRVSCVAREQQAMESSVHVSNSNPKIDNLVDEIAQLNLVEVRDFVKLLKVKLDIPDVAAMPMGMMAPAGAGVAAGEAEPAKEEKTAFTVKLTGFDTKSKVKVIKEIRAITKLGLKEAKALVESAPADVLKDIGKEEAEKLVEQIKAIGGEASLE